MKTQVVEKGEWERDLEVEVPAERIDAEVASALKKYRKRLEIPGFRKGKVPLKVVEERFGESIRSSVISDLLPTLMREAANEAGLVPAATPKITKLEHEPGQSLSFTANLDIWPQVDVTNDDLKVTRVTHEVSEDEISSQLEELRNRHATERSVERPLQKGDILIADLQRLDEAGIAIVGERFEERHFIIGAEDSPSPDFEEALVGIEAGQERKVTFSYRDDLSNPELAGKTEHFEVSAREIHERTLPEIDDEFAKDLGDQFQSLEDLRSKITEQLSQRWDYMSRQRMRSEMVDGLIRANSFELPNSLVEEYLEGMRREQEERGHDHPGHVHDENCDHNHDHEGPTEEQRTAAVRSLKTYLLLEAVRKKAGIEVSGEELEAHLVERSEQLGIRAEELKRSPRADEFRKELEEDKIFEYLTDEADIQEESV